MEYCRNCGTKVEAGWKVCSQCGSKLKEIEKPSDVCPKCGVQVKPDWNVCSECGSKLKAKPADLCTKCGTQVKPEWKICSNCGNELKKKKGRRIWSKVKFLAGALIALLALTMLLFFMKSAKDRSGDCVKPFLQETGRLCCLDEKSDKPCDLEGMRRREGASVGSQTTLKGAGESEVSSTTSTVNTPQTTTSSIQKEATTTLKQSGESCVGRYGVSTDTVIYLYTRKCCDPVVSDRVRAVEGDGFSFRWIDIESMTTEDKQVLDCFVLGDLYAPSFICPASGKGLMMTEPAGMQTKIENFARECEEASGGTSTTVKPSSSEAVKCTTNADCGKTKSEYICVSGNVYLKKEIPLCRSPGTAESNCIFSVTGLKSPEDSCGKDETCVPGESKCQKLED